VTGEFRNQVPGLEDMEMQYRRLGTSGPTVSAIGLGCMGMSGGVYGPADRQESIAIIHDALDAGITFLDTGDFYGMGHRPVPVPAGQSPPERRRATGCGRVRRFRFRGRRLGSPVNRQITGEVIRVTGGRHS
jgi:hypothetical protein